jgi:outer membrane protein TolC
MIKLFYILAALLVPTQVFNQRADTLKIDDCLRIVNERNPLIKQRNSAVQSFHYKIKNLSTNWYPAIGINAQAIYNSETVNFSDLMEDLPVEIPTLPLDQYKAWADINQQLYDGGTIRAQKAAEKANYDADVQQIESQLLGIRQQVNQIYFSLLITQNNSSILLVSLDELAEKKKVIQSAVDHGAVLPENILALEAEEMKFQQKITELSFTREQLLKALSVLMDSTLNSDLVLAEPDDYQNLNEPVNRPELLLFEKQKEFLLASQKLVMASDRPRLYAFSQAAYGRPGYNIISRDFHTFYSVGLGLKWNFINYGDSKRQKKILDLQKDIIDVKRETFHDQLSIQLQTEQSNMNKYDELLSQDEQIMKLRKIIASASLTKLNNGIITSTDYLNDMNAEVFARLQYESHRILKLQASHNYRLLLGRL